MGSLSDATDPLENEVKEYCDIYSIIALTYVLCRLINLIQCEI